jgi:plasmid stabilization system protein ParE
LKKQKYYKNFSELGRIVPELNDTTIRKIFVYSYRLIYKLYENKVLFVAVVHGKRVLENHQQSITKHNSK